MSELESAINVLVNAMIDSKANNYNQHIVSGDNGIDYVVTVQVKNGLTPCQKLAKIEAQSEWISVDSDPVDNGEYWCYCKDKYQRVRNFTYNRWSSDDVTHWQPLPEPPKGE